MRLTGSPQFLEARRRLAVERLEEGYTAEEIADFLGVETRSVYRWMRLYREQGASALSAQPVKGRPPKLSISQGEQVLSWLDEDAQNFGFATSRWTAPRLARLISQEWGVQLHPRYLNAWLTRRGISPQVPTPVAREKDPLAIAQWTAEVWPRIKKSLCFGRGLGLH